uniref:DNA-directed RNA polymerase n=1 Tax=Panagrolaimus sp. ES5 TaxID=591445 RepID=A0AC34GUS2_9BILA
MSLLIIKRLLHPKLVRSSCLPYDIASRKYSTSVAVQEEKPIVKTRKTTKKDTIEWEKSIIKKLSVEYQKRGKDVKVLSDKRRLMANTVNCVSNGNVKKLLGTATQDANLMKTTPNLIIFDEYFPVILKYSTAILKQEFESRKPNQWDEILYLIISFLSRVTPHDDVSAIGFLTTLKTVENFIVKHQQNLNLERVNNLLWSCKRKAKEMPPKFNLTHKQLLFDPAEIQEFSSVKQSASVPTAEVKDSYDPNLELVKTLCDPSFSPGYDSPFVINQRSKMDYIRDFEEQLQSEMGGYMKVENFTRRDKTAKSMEDYIAKWKWKENIEIKLKQHQKSIHDSFLNQCLSSVDLGKCAEIMLNTVHAELSEGQGHLSESMFRTTLADAVLHHVYNVFLEKLDVSPGRVTREVFSDFLEYFCDHKIAQIYSIRQWWNRCCSSQNVDPTLTLPCIDFKFYSRKKIGEILCKVVMESCTFLHRSRSDRAFTSANVSLESLSILSPHNKIKCVKMIHIHPVLKNMIKKIEFNHLFFSHKMLPLRVPPRPWIDKGKNGPFYTHPSDVIRLSEAFKDVNVCKEFDIRLTSDEMARPVFDALNDLGSTPWIINGEMLDVLTEIFKMGNDKTQEEFLSKLSVPLHAGTFIIPDFADIFGENANATEITTEEWRKFYKEKNEVTKNKNEMNSLWAWLRYRVALARHYRNDVLFFPHNMDFRGRVYPISPNLNHMGDDINRCVLKFAKGKRLGKRGLYWLKLHVVNITGLLKKKSILERIQYFDEHLEDILDSANNPLNGKRWWLESDDPWQTLAACKELRDALKLENPEDFVSHLPIHQDGSCNGLQHYAALGRDLQGALEVNLCPADKPADIYSTVAARVEEKRIEDEQDETSKFHNIALELRAALPEPVPRKVVKQTVMTTVYGVTEYGARSQIKKQLKALGKDEEHIVEFAAYLTERTFSSLHEAFEVSMQIKDWLRDVAKMCNSLKRPVEWTTPLGMPVMQPYIKTKSKLQKVVLLPSDDKQVNAFPPNFVHSLDSTHMMLTTLHCRKQGITFAAIHDCFWTHASTVDAMNKICRDQFIEMYTQPIIEKLAMEMREKCLPPALLRKMDEDTANKNIQQLTPSFKFGDLDISQVKDSVYFFS